MNRPSQPSPKHHLVPEKHVPYGHTVQRFQIAASVCTLPHAERGQSGTDWQSGFLGIGHRQNGAVARQVGKCVCHDGSTEVVALYFVATVSAHPELWVDSRVKFKAISTSTAATAARHRSPSASGSSTP